MTTIRYFFFFVIQTLFYYDSFSQVPNIFESPSILKDFLDRKTFNVPEYGTIRFDFNNSDTKRMRDAREKDGADDEVVDLIFDVTIKRNEARRKDKSGYKIELKIDLRDPSSTVADPASDYINYFMLARNIIYPIKGFPSNYYLFADGDLYFSKVLWKKIPFNDYKSIMTSTKKGSLVFLNMNDSFREYVTTSFIKCTPVLTR